MQASCTELEQNQLRDFVSLASFASLRRLDRRSPLRRVLTRGMRRQEFSLTMELLC